VPEREDVFDSFEEAIRARPDENSWQLYDDIGDPTCTSDHVLLETLIGIPVSEGRRSESGRLAKAIDAWAAHEL